MPRPTAWLLVAIAVLQWSPILDACTILGVGRQAMADGTTVITHNDDSSVADFPLRIVPAQDWPDGATRKVVANAHTREGGNVLGDDAAGQAHLHDSAFALLLHE